MGRRVLVTGVARFIGLRLAMQLAADDHVEELIGVDLDDPPFPIAGMEFVRVDIRNPLVARVIEATRVDTIVHTNIASAAGRFGGRAHMKESNVIGTMQLLAAAQRARKISKVVVKSSAAVYGSYAGAPSILSEGHASDAEHLSGYGRDCAEAETYARDFGRRRPDVDLVILRTQNVVGPTVTTGMTGYLSLPAVPTALGFDPRLQLLHEEDAVAAFAAATIDDCRGLFNVAAEGVVYLSQAIRMLGSIELPMLLPAARPMTALLRRLGIADVPADQIKVILFDRVVDTSRARAAFFNPGYTTSQCIEDFRHHHRGEDVLAERPHPAWERELFEYLRQRSEPPSGIFRAPGPDVRKGAPG